MSRYVGKTPPGCLSGTGMAWLYTVSRFLEVLFEKPFGEGPVPLPRARRAPGSLGFFQPVHVSTRCLGVCPGSTPVSPVFVTPRIFRFTRAVIEELCSISLLL